jgi:PPM family protein phosphatase
MVIRPDVELANISDVGCRRTQNEDYFLYCEPRDDDAFLRRGRLLVVADGMGAHRGGEVASRMAVDIVRDTFFNYPSPDPREVLIEGFAQAHHRICECAGRSADLEGMGTTCSAAIVRGGQLTFGHIGDSRLYLIRDGAARPLTDDHTITGQLLRAGAISTAEARTHEMRHVLTAALGADAAAVTAEFAEQPWQLQTQDVLLLCSDGLHGVVEEQEMVSMTHMCTMYDASRALVNLAKERGGPDNITVQLLRICEIHA